MLRAEQGQGWTLPEDDKPVIQTLLALHDRQLASVPAHRYRCAWEQLERFIVSDKRSPFQFQWRHEQRPEHGIAGEDLWHSLLCAVLRYRHCRAVRRPAKEDRPTWLTTVQLIRRYR